MNGGGLCERPGDGYEMDDVVGCVCGHEAGRLC